MEDVQDASPSVKHLLTSLGIGLNQVAVRIVLDDSRADQLEVFGKQLGNLAVDSLQVAGRCNGVQIQFRQFFVRLDEQEE